MIYPIRIQKRAGDSRISDTSGVNYGSVALTNKAAEIGYKLAMVRTPHYYKNLINNTEAQVRYFNDPFDSNLGPAEEESSIWRGFAADWA